jgi:hypothetical protein
MCVHISTDAICATGIIIANTVLEQFNITGFGGCIGLGGMPIHGCGAAMLIPITPIGRIIDKTVGTPVIIGPIAVFISPIITIGNIKIP